MWGFIARARERLMQGPMRPRLAARAITMLVLVGSTGIGPARRDAAHGAERTMVPKQAAGAGPIAAGQMTASRLLDDAGAEGLVPDLRKEALSAMARRAKLEGSNPIDGLAQALLAPAGTELGRTPGRLAAPGADDDGIVGVWDGFAFSGWLPASPHVAAGPDQVVMTVNARIRVMDKRGNTVVSNSLRRWLESAVQPLGTSGVFVFSPWVVYDATAARFVLSALGTRMDGETVYLVGVSKTSRADGDWCTYGMSAAINGDVREDVMAADLRLGLNDDVLVLSANMASRTTGRFAYAKTRLLPKSTFYDTTCPASADWADIWSFQEPERPVSDLRPVVGRAGDHDAYLVNARFDAGDALSLWRVRTEPGPAPLGQPARRFERLEILVPHFSIAPDALQPGTDTRVSTGSASLHAAVQHGQHLWTSHTVACNWPADADLRACARWYQLDLDGASLLQSGTFGQPGAFVFDPEVMPDPDGNVAIVVNRSSPQVALEGAMVCRRRDAELGLTDGLLNTLVQGEGCYVRLGGTDYNRWGLHNGIALDPISGRTWIHTAYASGSSGDCTANAWRTALADVSCAPIAAPVATSPAAKPTQQPLQPRGGAPTPRPTLAPSCRAAVDIMLVLDSSGSIGPNDYEKVRGFARAFAASLKVAPDGARIGIVQFSSENQNRLEIGLSDDPTALNAAIRDMRWLAGGTDMDDGLRIGWEELEANGRPGVPRVIILMSDGQPNRDPAQRANAIKAAGTRLLTIGVGSGINADLMRRLASSPPEDNFVFAEEFDTLLEIVDGLVVDLCPPDALPTPTTAPSPDPRLARRIFLPATIKDPACPPDDIFVDVTLVVDASTSMLAPGPDGRPKYAAALDATRLFASRLRLLPGGDQLALVAFNREARLLLPLTDDAALADAALRAFTPIRTGSRLDLGVRRAADELSGPRVRGRARAMVVLSDGQASHAHGLDAILAAQAARALGVKVYVIGLGHDMNRATLEPLAGSPSRFFHAITDDLLPSVLGDLAPIVTCPPEAFWPFAAP